MSIVESVVSVNNHGNKLNKNEWIKYIRELRKIITNVSEEVHFESLYFGEAGFVFKLEESKVGFAFKRIKDCCRKFNLKYELVGNSE